MGDIKEKLLKITGQDEESKRPQFYYTYYGNEDTLVRIDDVRKNTYDKENLDKNLNKPFTLILHDMNEKFNVDDYLSDLAKSITYSDKKSIVFIVDWSNGANTPLILIDDHARRTVEWTLYDLKYMIDDNALERKGFTIIGIGFGAHLAGLIAKQGAHYGIEPGQIIALNPTIAMMYFRQKEHRLDKNDAYKTISIYSDAGIFYYLTSKLSPYTKTSYILNDGRNQPSCSIFRFKTKFFTEYFHCSFYRAVKVLIRLYKNQLVLHGFKCESYSELTYCNERQSGFNIDYGFSPLKGGHYDSRQLTLYTPTLSRYPFINHPLVMTLTIEGFNFFTKSIEVTFYCQYGLSLKKVIFSGTIYRTFSSNNLIILMYGSEIPYSIKYISIYTQFSGLTSLNLLKVQIHKPADYNSLHTICPKLRWNGGSVNLGTSNC